MCCRHESGYVFLSQADLDRLSEELSLPVHELRSRYCREVNISGFRRLSLTEQSNLDCVFFRDGRCSVYENRPLQCRSYPFWGTFTGSPEDWNREAESCPGINVGALHSRQDIEHRQRLRQSEPFLELSD
jgi:hypothetical protein